MFFISLVHPTPGCDLQIEHVLPRACISLENRVLDLAIAVFDFVSAGAEFLAKITQASGSDLHVRQLSHGFKIFESELFTSTDLFAGPAKRQWLVIRKNDVRTQAADNLPYVVIESAHHGGNTDHNGNTDNYTQHRER